MRAFKEPINISNVVLDDYDEPEGYEVVFSALADVDVKSGKQLAEIGTVFTSNMITVLTWNDDRAKNSHYVEWEGRHYEISHIKPSRDRQTMLITAELVMK